MTALDGDRTKTWRRNIPEEDGGMSDHQLFLRGLVAPMHYVRNPSSDSSP